MVYLAQPFPMANATRHFANSTSTTTTATTSTSNTLSTSPSPFPSPLALIIHIPPSGPSPSVQPTPKPRNGNGIGTLLIALFLISIILITSLVSLADFCFRAHRQRRSARRAIIVACREGGNPRRARMRDQERMREGVLWGVTLV